jgi:deoxycytidylate deaminase
MLVFYLGNKSGGKNDVTPIEWGGFDCYSWSTHAEMRAIALHLSVTRQNRGRRKRHGKTPFTGKMPKTIYVVSYYKGTWRNSRPCDDCLRVLRYYGVKRVVYSTGSPDPDRFFCVEKVNEMEFHGRSSGNRRYVLD